MGYMEIDGRMEEIDENIGKVIQQVQLRDIHGIYRKLSAPIEILYTCSRERL